MTPSLKPIPNSATAHPGGSAVDTHLINCSEVWGGIRGENVDARTSGVVASLYSNAADGGKGGDIYYISECSSRITRVAVADVRGHGQTVSDISCWLYRSLQARINDIEGAEMLTELNALACEQGYQAMTTAAVVSFYPDDSTLYLAYAGHPPVLIFRQEVKRWEFVTLQPQQGFANLPLGAFPDVAYHQEAKPIGPGDRLFLYTDGLIDAQDSVGRFFGHERLLTVLEKAAQGTVLDLRNAVHGALCEHTDGSLVHDDVTFITLELRSPERPADPPATASC